MSRFTIYPAIDLLSGKCVRLHQGDFEKETVFSESPQEVAKQFIMQGAEWIHIVDLDGAKAGKRVNDKIIQDIVRSSSVKIQVGGGIRSREDFLFYMEAGVSRVVLGSSVLTDPPFVKEMLKNYRSSIAIGLDARNGFVATEGWTKMSHVRAAEIGKELADAGAEVFIYTDISTDGTLAGPNLEEALQLAESTGKEVISSGGISSLADLEQLAALKDQGIKGAIVGKALYTKQFSLNEAIEMATAK